MLNLILLGSANAYLGDLSGISAAITNNVGKSVNLHNEGPNPNPADISDVATSWTKFGLGFLPRGRAYKK